MADYSSIQDYGPVLRDVTIGCVVPTTVIFFWRMGSKLPTFNNRIGFGFYDVMLALAMIFSWLSITFVLIAVKNGFGQPGKLLKVEEKKKAMFFFWLIQIDYKFQVMFAKLSVLLFYCAVFSADSTFVKCTRYFIGFTIVASVAFGIANIFQCKPVERAWNRALPGTCFNNEIYWISHATFHVATDLAIFFMPIVPISKLNMSSSKKLAVIGAFALGSIVCIADCIRIYYLKVSAKSTDPTYGASMAVLMTIIVQFVSLICICLVTGLRRSIITCCRQMRDNKDTKRSGYQLSDVQSSQNQKSSKSELWQKSPHRIMVNTTVSEEHIVGSEPESDNLSDKDKRFRPDHDIVVKTTFQVTDSSPAVRERY